MGQMVLLELMYVDVDQLLRTNLSHLSNCRGNRVKEERRETLEKEVLL